MISKIAYVLIFLSFFVFLLLVGELYILRTEVQGAFDRSVSIASDPIAYQESPDKQIDEVAAEERFLFYLAQNLSLSSSLTAVNSSQKIRQVYVESFSVLNVISSTVFSFTNSFTGEIIQGEIDRPSVLALGVVEVELSLVPLPIRIPVFSISSGMNPL